MKKYIILFALCLGFAFSSCKTETKNEHKKHTEEIAKKEYMCPMNCEKGKTYKDKDKKCPVCKMKLVDKEKLKEH